MKKIGILALIILALFVTCLPSAFAQGEFNAASQPSSGSEESSQNNLPPSEYIIQPEDAMKITVINEEKLSAEQIVDPNGYINLPQIGEIYAAGLSQQELIGKIKQALKKYLVDPKVQITMIQFRRPKVFVLGQVNRPGVYDVKPGDRIMEAIAQAASFNQETAYLENAKLTHKGSDEQITIDLDKIINKGDMTQNLELQDGDSIFIPENTLNKYLVVGEVLRPSVYRFRENTTVLDAITTAGGPTQRGDLKSTFVLRGDQNNPQRIKVDLKKLTKSADMTQNVLLQPGDVVYLAETSKPDWNKVSGIVSAIVNSSYLFRMWGL